MYRAIQPRPSPPLMFATRESHRERSAVSDTFLGLLVGALDLWLGIPLPRRVLFGLLAAVFVLGLLGVAANMFEPGRPSF